MNVQHRTPNVEHPMMMTLRFIFLIQTNHTGDALDFIRTSQSFSKRDDQF
jgi:hypothetical protein